ncbi:MAG: hypothetical protein FJ244_07020 [Nitrospira sp.]|nr:hypothetical protein [Nitrospira sp.]
MLRVRLIQEEFDELREALAQADPAAVASEFLKKGTQFDKMARSFKEVTDALNSLTKKFPSK